MSTESVKKSAVEPQADVEEIPIGVSVDGEVVPVEEVLELAEMHFQAMLPASETAIYHEALSMVPAALDVATNLVSAVANGTPALGGYTNISLGSLILSTPILLTLRNSYKGVQRDLHRVHKVREHYEKHKDPSIVHVLGFQLEGFTHEPKQYELEFVENSMCEKDLLAARKLDKNSSATSKKGVAVVKDVACHIGGDIKHIVRHPKVFYGDIKAGWKTVFKQAANHPGVFVDTLKEECREFPKKVGSFVKLKAHNNPLLRPVFFRAVDSKSSIAQNNSAVAHSNEKVGHKVENEVRRLHLEKKIVQKRMVSTGLMFPLEKGFVTFEGVGGVLHLLQGNVGMGLAHLFSSTMALHPASVLGRQNEYNYNNYMSKRAQAVEDYKPEAA